jgi:glycine cleavage system H protein
MIMVALMVVLTIITFLTIDYFVQHAERRRVLAAPRLGAAAPAARPVLPVLFGPPIDRVPEHVFLDRGHTWAELEPEGTLRIGSDRWAPALLGLPESIVLATPGTKVKKGDVCAYVRRQGREIQLHAPVSGVIADVNARLASDPEQMARDPFDHGWLVRVRPEALGASLRSLLIGDEIVSWMRAELGQLRERLAALGPRELGMPIATMLDGGLPAEGVAAFVTADEWQAIADAIFAPVTDRDR